MKKIMKYLPLFVVGVVLIVAGFLSMLNNAATSETNRVDFENIEILNADNDSILWKADIKNNTKDRTITGITWKVEIYDTLRRTLVDELYNSQTHCVVIGESAGEELINIAPGKKDTVVSCIPNYQGDKYAWRSNYYPRISLSNYESK